MGRNQGREDFEHGIKSLLILKENGGSLHVQQRGSQLSLDLLRAEGGDDDAVVLLRVPRSPWSEGCAEKLSETFDAHDLDASIAEEQDSQVLAEVRIRVEDIWEESCGAKGARAAHLLLDSLSVPRDARIDCTLHGVVSKRWREHQKRLRQAERA